MRNPLSFLFFQNLHCTLCNQPRPAEITLVARLLATQKKPIGMYFVNEDIFTLASYYQEDMREKKFFPSPDWQMLPDDPAEERRELLE